MTFLAWFVAKWPETWARLQAKVGQGRVGGMNVGPWSVMGEEVAKPDQFRGSSVARFWSSGGVGVDGALRSPAAPLVGRAMRLSPPGPDVQPKTRRP